MNTYDYHATSSHVAANTSIKESDLFQIDEAIDSLKEKCQYYFNFFQTYLDEYFIELGVSNAFFVFKNDRRINACAYSENGVSVVVFNIGLIHQLISLFETNSDILPDEPFYDSYKRLENDIQRPIRMIMFEIIILFIFYHEVANLVQRSKMLSSGLEKKPNDYSSYSFEKHLLEIYADTFACTYMGRHLLSYFKKINSETQCEIQFHQVTSILCSALTLFKLGFIQFSEEVYIRDKSHPHALLRFMAIVTNITNYANLTLTKDTDLNRIKLNISSVYDKSLQLTRKLYSVIYHKDLKFQMKSLSGFSKSKISNYYNEIIDAISKDSKMAMSKRNKLST